VADPGGEAGIRARPLRHDGVQGRLVAVPYRGAGDEEVVGGPGREVVRAAAADQDVPASPADQGVVACAADKEVVAAASLEVYSARPELAEVAIRAESPKL
jgi:hypothetical protein